MATSTDPSRASERFLRVAFETIVVVGVTHAFAERFVFGEMIVPRYGGVHGVPLAWWVAMYAPVFVGCVVLGIRAHSTREAALAGVVAGLVAAIEKLVLALAHAPGHETSLVIVSPARFWTVQLVRMTFGFVVLLVLAHFVAQRTRRP